MDSYESLVAVLGDELAAKCKNNLATKGALKEYLKQKQEKGELTDMSVDDLVRMCLLKEGKREGELQVLDKVLLGNAATLEKAQATQILIEETPEGRSIAKIVRGLVWMLGKAGMFQVARGGFYVVMMPVKAAVTYASIPVKIVLSPIFWIMSWMMWVTKLLFMYVPLAQMLIVVVNRDLNTVNTIFDFYLNIISFIVQSFEMVYGGAPYIRMVGDAAIAALQVSKTSVNATAIAAAKVKESKLMTTVVSSLSGLLVSTQPFTLGDVQQQQVIEQVSTTHQKAELLSILETYPDVSQYIGIGATLLFLIFFVLVPMMRRFSSPPSGSGVIQSIAERFTTNAPTAQYVTTKDECDQASYMGDDGECKPYTEDSVKQCPPGQNFHFTSMRCKSNSTMIDNNEAYNEQKYKRWANKRK